ncbi:MAG: bifunctional hydroxymethylpyrimidine kinase/phosphomethylpyrimidine kinase [Planctomycetes bacterium]|nr:bifunctional hydroxymethylpyrimidine kinase/phosphomethylpyrimidine kinase [Planctomycetota bacterium]MCC7171422.1 bifunctional hydroxymethylpyrimidine kinase/phosphomethylpyrimidine kinase [Planctomycetota bacterium]
MTRRAALDIRIPLTIAGADPTGGAGIEADLKVFAAFGWSGAAVATALTEQDTRRVHAVHAIDAKLVARRLARLLDDVRVAGAKTGLLASADQVKQVAKLVRTHAIELLVVDPVLAPTRGKAFLDERGQKVLWRELLPLATVFTPNLDEAAALLGATRAAIAKHPERACRALLESGARAVLLKGGHAKSKEAVDLYADARRFALLTLPRVTAKRGGVHGTGCALSAALLALLIGGADPADAAMVAKRWVRKAIEHAETIGAGRARLKLT